MTGQVQRLKSGNEEEAALRRKAAAFQEAPGETEAEASRDAFLSGAAIGSIGLPSALATADQATLARAMNRLQQGRGNSFVQRVVSEARGTPGRLVGQSQADMVQEVLQRKGSGNQMPAEASDRLAMHFGTPMDAVRVHADGEAAALSRELDARAFTVGSDIFFAEGQYDPHSTDGQALLAHEVTHVGQQTGFGSAAVQRDGAAVAPAAPQTFTPPTEALQGRLPQIFFPQSIDTQPLYEAIKGANWPSITRMNNTWEGWSAISAITSPDFVSTNLNQMVGGGGFIRALPTDKGHFADVDYQLTIKGRITNPTFISADATGISASGQGGPSVSSGTSITNTTKAGLEGGIEKKDTASAKASVGSETGFTQSSGLADSGQVTRAVAAGARALFSFDIDWDITLEMQSHLATWVTVLGLGVPNAVAELEDGPRSVNPAKSSGKINFLQTDCGVPDTAVGIGPFRRPG